MRKRGFPAEWIRWVKCCITFHSFSVLVNRHPEGEWIKPQRGVRLGCPLALLHPEGGAICTTQACFHERLRGFHTISYSVGIPFFWYADYTNFSMEGSVEEAKNLSALLDLFVDVSGLKINRGKSIVVCFGLSSEEEVHCSQALGTKTTELPMRYLSLLFFF